MNKRLSYIFLPLLALSSCTGTSENKTNGKLCFSEFYVNDDLTNVAVEIYNLSDTSIDLNKYKVVVYEGHSQNKREIPLNGSLDSGATFIIASSSCDDELRNKANIISEQFENDGSWPICLMEGNHQIDILGIKGYRIDFGRGCDLIRKKSKLFGRKEFVELDYMRYNNENLSRLGNVDNPISEEEFLIGPHLTDEDFNRKFAINSEMGGGGAIRVDLNYTIDGDTTSFRIKDDLSAYGIRSTESVRYFDINTPEIDHGPDSPADPWGNAARDYTNSLLRNARSFAISTSPNHTLRETYGRMFCYVWISDIVNPQPEDFILLNLLIVKEGYSKYFSTDIEPNSYKGVSYTYFLKNAELTAASLKKHVHGETDPNYNY